MRDSVAIEEAVSDGLLPLEDLRRRLIAFKTLNPKLQVLTVVTITVLVGSGALLAIAHLLSWRITTAVSPKGQIIQTPLVVYVTTAASMYLGWSFITVASMRVHPAARLGLCFVITGALGAGPTLQLFDTMGDLGGPYDINENVALLAAQVLILVILVSLVLGTTVAKGSWKGARRGIGFDALLCGLLCLYFLADAQIVMVYNPSASPAHFIQSSLASQATLLPGLLAVVVYWGSTDFIEWGEMFASHAATLLSRRAPAWLVVALMALIAGAFSVDTFRRLHILPLLPSLLTSVVVIGLAVFLVRLAHIDAAWPLDVPVGALIGGAAFLFLFVQVSQTVVLWVSNATHLPGSAINPFYTILSVLQAGVLLGIGLFLIRRGRKSDRRETSATGMFFAMIAILVIGLSAPQIANVVGLPVIPESQLNVADLKVIASVGLVSMALWLGCRKRLTNDVVSLFAAAFMLVMGLQVIGWYFQLFVPSLHALSSTSVIVAAVIFIGAIIWDVVTSGDQVTNRETVAFPRTARVLLYLGYALFACATFLYATSQFIASTGQPVPVPSAGVPLEVVGAEGLGLPLLAWNLARRIQRRSNK